MNTLLNANCRLEERRIEDNQYCTTYDDWRLLEQVYVYVMHKDRLNGRVAAVTVTSPPSGTSSDTLFSKFGRVAASSCGGAWK
jgi:hypothetical protein